MASQPQQQQIDLKTLSDLELKGVLYDLNILMGRTQQNIKTVTQELESRFNNTSTEAVSTAS